MHARPAICTVLITWCCVAWAAPALAKQLVLVENGKSSYHIVVARSATIQDHHAARVLQKHIKQMTGAELSIIADDNALGQAEIIVGFNRHVDRLAPELRDERYGREELHIKTVGPHLIIVGGAPRGVLYGVNSMLSKEWGCRWFTPDIKLIPKVERLALRPTDRRYEPPFEWREVGFWSGMHNEWTFHNCLNQWFADLSLEQGGRAGYSYSFFVHSALSVVPPAIYLEDHPEYFWKGEDDQPRYGRTTRNGIKGWIGICTTHPGVVEAAAKRLIEARRQHPAGGDIIYCISKMDYDDWCECPTCKQWHKRQLGGHLPENPGQWPIGAMWLDFAARVADRLKNEPDAPRIGTLAYGDSAAPPRVAPNHQNVNVFYAELAADQFHALTSQHNSTFRNRVEQWVRSAGSVYVYRYLVNYECWSFIHPNMHTFAEDLRYLRETGVKGLYNPGNRHIYKWNDGIDFRFDGEMSELRAYLLARLLWNPDLDWRAERREFCAAYYGSAAGAVIEEYLDDVRKAFVEQDVGCLSWLGVDGFRWITPQMFERWYAYLDKAESLAKEDHHKHHVRIARMPVHFTQASIEEDEAKRTTLMQSYLDTARKLGLDRTHMVRENYDLKTWADANGLEWK